MPPLQRPLFLEQEEMRFQGVPTIYEHGGFMPRPSQLPDQDPLRSQVKALVNENRELRKKIEDLEVQKPGSESKFSTPKEAKRSTGEVRRPPKEAARPPKEAEVSRKEADRPPEDMFQFLLKAGMTSQDAAQVVKEAEAPNLEAPNPPKEAARPPKEAEISKEGGC